MYNIKLSDTELKLIKNILSDYLQKNKVKTISEYMQREKADKIKTFFERLGG